jgi:hypothetical protein
VFANISSATILSFGNLRAEALYLAITIVFITALAVVLFLVLTRALFIREELRAVAGRPINGLSPWKTAGFLVPIWLLACGWFYNATLGSRFFELEPARTADGKITWNAIYHYPHRVRAIADKEITNWTGAFAWARRSLRHALVLELEDGRTLRSSGLAPEEFKQRAEKLRELGVSIVTEPDPAAR